MNICEKKLSMIVDAFLLFEYWDNLQLIKVSLVHVCKNVLKSYSVEHILASGPGIGETEQR